MFRNWFVILALVTLVNSDDLLSEFKDELIKMTSPLPWLDPDQINTLFDQIEFGVDSGDPPKPSDICEDDTKFHPTVSHPEFGTAKGRVITSLNGKQFYGFHSIPYAKPITPSERFKVGCFL